jgi:hypothetical protein
LGILPEAAEAETGTEEMAVAAVGEVRVLLKKMIILL